MTLYVLASIEESEEEDFETSRQNNVHHHEEPEPEDKERGMLGRGRYILT